ncbi:MAG: thioesterase family protein [Deltaproteobacteria bacterium]|nr:thioesterase family protein [Deltaproteobacteria bacterium]
MNKKLKFRCKERVRYSDCDMHQHLNHARYFSFLEQARVDYFKKTGFIKGTGYKAIPFIIAAAHCDYLAPAHLGDIVEIRLGTTHIGNKSFRIDYEMRDLTTKTLLATAYTIQVMFDYDKMRSIPVPKILKRKL